MSVIVEWITVISNILNPKLRQTNNREYRVKELNIISYVFVYLYTIKERGKRAIRFQICISSLLHLSDYSNGSPQFLVLNLWISWIIVIHKRLLSSALSSILRKINFILILIYFEVRSKYTYKFKFSGLYLILNL